MRRPDFAEIRRRCHGMMRVEVYEAIYDAARTAPGSVFVEIGTGHGAGTVCLTLGLRDAGKEGVVYTFDRFEGGSRKPYGDAGRNEAIAREALKSFGVDSMVRVVAGDIAETSSAVPADEEIGLLMLDVDGRIDRDLGLFLARVLRGAPVIIDDCSDRVRAKDKGDHLRIDQKHRITHLLVESAIAHGLIEHTGTVNQTWFGRKAGGMFLDWPSSAIIEAYRGLVFANAEKA